MQMYYNLFLGKKVDMWWLYNVTLNAVQTVVMATWKDGKPVSKYNNLT